MAAYSPPSGLGLPPELRDYYLNFSDPTAGFWDYLKGAGQGRSLPGRDQAGGNMLDQSSFGKWTQDQDSRYQAMWRAASANEPNLGYQSFLGRQDPWSEYASMAPSQQGFFSNILTPRGRTILR